MTSGKERIRYWRTGSRGRKGVGSRRDWEGQTEGVDCLEVLGGERWGGGPTVRVEVVCPV